MSRGYPASTPDVPVALPLLRSVGRRGCATPMELVIRKYFWAVNLCFVALAALLAAKTVNLFIEAAIAPAPSAPTARGTTRTAQSDAPATLDLSKLAQLTNLPLPKEEATEQVRSD